MPKWQNLLRKVGNHAFGGHMLRYVLGFLLGMFIYGGQVAAFEETSLVVCGIEDESGSTELYNRHVARGGFYENRLVIRNSNILEDFLEKRAIFPEELSSSGEFAVAGVGTENSMAGRIGSRSYRFFQEGDGYTLVVHQISEDGHSLRGVIAHFHFRGDCQIKSEPIHRDKSP